MKLKRSDISTDGGLRNNSKVARKPIESVGCRLFEIPSRSPDINPIENLFHLIQRHLTEDAPQYNITKETYEEFSNQVKNTIQNFPVSAINKPTESMNIQM